MCVLRIHREGTSFRGQSCHERNCLAKNPKICTLQDFPAILYSSFQRPEKCDDLVEVQISNAIVLVVHHMVSISFSTSAILFSEWDGLFGYRTAEKEG